MEHTKHSVLLSLDQWPIHNGHRQVGAVLITALVLLVIMTLLGLTTMSTSYLEERMAANSQEISRSFQVADAGLTQAFLNADSLNTTDAVTETITGVGGYNATINYTASLRQVSRLGRSADSREIWGANYGKYHFELESNGLTRGGVATRLIGGIAQIGPLAE